MFSRSMAAVVIAGVVSAVAAYAADHRDAPLIRPDAARLATALKKFESDAGRRAGRGAASSLSDNAIIIVGGKTGIPGKDTISRGPSISGAVGPPCRPRPKGSQQRLRLPPPDDTKRRVPNVRGVKAPSLEDRGIIIINGRPGSLKALSAEIRRFEKSLFPPNPCVTACRATARRCMANCRSALRGQRLQGQCSCEPVQARCLVRSASQGKCSRPSRRGLR